MSWRGARRLRRARRDRPGLRSDRLPTAGAFTLRTEFTGAAGARPGANPAGGFFLNTDGALYGTTEFGGVNDFGTAFKITTGASFTSLRAFADPTGSQPAGTLVRGADGQLYGATAAGGWRLAAGGWRLAAGGWRLAALPDGAPCLR